jgi:hypothetical protein
LCRVKRSRRIVVSTGLSLWPLEALRAQDQGEPGAFWS